jgi:2-dehydro-3-deoxygluconokinase
VLASTEDLELLFGGASPIELSPSSTSAELVLKLPRLACHVMGPGIDQVVEAEPVSDVVDTTAAGDSFAAAYLAARLKGADPKAAARAGHKLAGTVVRYPGAIIPPAAMPAADDEGNASEA